MFQRQREAERLALEDQYREKIQRLSEVAYLLGKVEKFATRYPQTMAFLHLRLQKIQTELASFVIPLRIEESNEEVARWQLEGRQALFDDRDFVAEMDQVEGHLSQADTFLRDIIEAQKVRIQYGSGDMVFDEAR